MFVPSWSRALNDMISTVDEAKLLIAVSAEKSNLFVNLQFHIYMAKDPFCYIHSSAWIIYNLYSTVEIVLCLVMYGFYFKRFFCCDTQISLLWFIVFLTISPKTKCNYVLFVSFIYYVITFSFGYCLIAVNHRNHNRIGLMFVSAN